MPLLSVLFAASILQGPAFDFYPYGPYASGVPKPESILGYQPGKQHTTFREQEQVVFAITKALPKKTKVWEFGKSWEGRPLKLVAISSESNIAKLEELRKRMEKVGNGDLAAAGDLEKLPAFVWVNQTIHGNESASFESAMWLIYNLAASRSKSITEALEKVVVLVNPVYNPDGHERFVVWNRSLSVLSAHPSAFEGYEPDWVHGRTNHFRFDMNRDRVAFSQPETQAEVREYQRWNPQVYIDQHGQTSEYFFPPNAMATNINVDRERLEKWTQIFGRAYAKAFDEKGWLYFIRDGFDFYAATYLDTYATLMGAIGMTHETDGGRRLMDTKDDGSPLTVELGMAKHFTTAMTTVLTAAEKRRELLDMFFTYKRKAVTGDHAGKFQRVVATADDARPLIRLKKQLADANIKSYFVGKFSQPDAHDYWSEKTGPQEFPNGGLVIDMAQPNGQLAKAMLEPGQDFEKEFYDRMVRIGQRMDKKDRYPDPEGSEFYDITGWSLIYCHDLKAWWCESAPKISTEYGIEAGSDEAPKLKDSEVGYALPYSDQNDILAAFDLAMKGVKCRVMTKAMKLGGVEFPRGTFFMMKGRNDSDLRETITSVLKKRHGAYVVPIPSGFPESGSESPGGTGMSPIREPKIGVVFGDDSSTQDFGGTWFLLEKAFGIEFVPLHKSALTGDLNEFSCILFPPGANTASDKVKQWIQAGGCAVVLGSPGWAIGDGKLVNLAVTGENAKSVPGTFFKANLDNRSFLSLGYDRTGKGTTPLAMMVEGRNQWKGGTGGLGAVAFGDEDKKLLSGWAWPDDTEKNLKGAYAVYEQPLGSGHVVVFANNPCDRAMFPGQHKLLLNAILLGPN